MLGVLSAVGGIFSSISGIAQGWFNHKIEKAKAARDIEVEQIKAGVQIQGGSWKDEYLVVLWTAPIIPAMLDSIIHWDPNMTVFLAVVNALPSWYTGLLLTITTASFGIKGLVNWKASKLDRELKWDRHAKNGDKPVEPPGFVDPEPEKAGD